MTLVEVTGPAIPRLTRREIAAFIRRVLLELDRMGHLGKEIAEASIAFVDDEEMTRLNRTFRRKKRTTDVLTFPADETYGDPRSTAVPLGDIVISVEQARRQAAEEGHSLANEVRYLILHGVLHALGWDHETDRGEMHALELELRDRVGL